jgi:hypothetical protein
MKRPIYGVWHLCVEGLNWEDTFYEQENLILDAVNFADKIFINISGHNTELDSYLYTEYFSYINSGKIEIYHSPNLHDFEYSSLKIIYDLANRGSIHCPIENQPYGKVQHPFDLFYIHSKSSFLPNSERRENAILWRKYMEYFTLTKWEDCVEALKDSYICGVEWRIEPLPHFSGNFWWAKSEYLQKLPNILDYWSQNKFERIWAEMYIGQANPKVKDFSNFGADMYKVSITEDMYNKIED